MFMWIKPPSTSPPQPEVCPGTFYLTAFLYFLFVSPISLLHRKLSWAMINALGALAIAFTHNCHVTWCISLCSWRSIIMWLEKHTSNKVFSIVLYHQAIAFAAWSMTVGGRVRLSPRAPWILRNSLVHCSCATESDGIMESMSGWVPGTWNLWMNTDCHARWDQLLGVIICSTQFTSVALFEVCIIMHWTWKNLNPSP